jgi:methyl-accepting chemotaxis protein
VANGNTQDKEILDKKIQNVEDIIKRIKTGENIDGQIIGKVPAKLNSDYQNLSASWENYRDSIHNIEEITVFDKEASIAINYILNKNNELILSANDLNKEIQNLDRDYSRHKEIAKDLLECSKFIGQQTLLISIGEDTNSQEELKEKKLQFEIGIRKLLQLSTSDLDVQSVGAIHEELIPLPRENSNALRDLDPLWESMQVKLSILEERALLSPEFITAKENMFEQKEVFYSDIDKILENWSQIILEHESDELVIVQVILGVDIIIFIIVLYIIRNSLRPFESITQAISKMKEGVYGETIQYSGTDEVGKLVENFNTMSNTIKGRRGKEKHYCKR